MQCKAIELLEVLFEETDANYALVIKTISKDLKTDHVIEYIKNMYEHYVRCYSIEYWYMYIMLLFRNKKMKTMMKLWNETCIELIMF